MTILSTWGTQWLRGEAVSALALSLGHFLWEGLGLALLLFVALAFCRSARTRYALAVLTLTGMMIAPVLTFTILSRGSGQAIGQTNRQVVQESSRASGPVAAPAFPHQFEPSSSAEWPAWCAGVWLAGVLVFSIRATGGWLVLARLRRQCTQTVTAELIETCRVFERRLGLSRSISYLQSKVTDTPSVIGWFRPIVLIPASALTGLSQAQLEAIIVHELAHIKRLDCLVNLVQIAAETLFFYNPAVWWVNRVIRNERENCCDDISVEICGNVTEYARALTLLESARAAPSWALNATGGRLKARVMRLLRPQSAVAAVSTAGLATLGIFCTAGVLLTAAVVTRTAVVSPVAIANKIDPRPVQSASVQTAVSQRTVTTVSVVAAPESPKPDEFAQAQPAPEPPPSSAASGGSSYIEGLKAAGLKDLTIDQIIALKIQGVTPEYIGEMRNAGVDAGADDLIALRVQGVTPEYVKETRAAGLNPTTHELIAMKVQGITPAYVHEMQSIGLNDLKLHDLIAMKIQNVDPEYVRAIRAEGLSPNAHELIAMKVQDVTPEYVRALKSAGFSNLRVHDYIGAKVQDITPQFIEKVRSHGFKNLTMHQLIALKNAEVF